MRLSSAKERNRVLSAALDSGVTHFDVARMYGLGAAEAELGRALRGRRAEVTIATKFGIEPRSGLGPFVRLQGPARALLARFPALKSTVKRHGETFNAPRRYDAEAARRSLERSLSEVGTDYFDILFLHDPGPHDEVMVEELLSFFSQARDEGKIRAWGVASEGEHGGELVTRFGTPAVLQRRYDIFESTSVSAPAERPLILFGFLSSALARLGKMIETSPDLDQQLKRIVGNAGDREQLADFLLLDALSANQRGVVLLGTTKPDRIARAAKLASQSLGEQVELFRATVAQTRSAAH